MNATETNRLIYSPEETARIVQELESWQQGEIDSLTRVIRGQHDGAGNGWWDVFCVENDAHCEVSNGPRESLRKFAARCFELGWSVESLERNQAICSACVNAPDTSHYAAQYRSDSGGLL